MINRCIAMLLCLLPLAICSQTLEKTATGPITQQRFYQLEDNLWDLSDSALNARSLEVRTTASARLLDSLWAFCQIDNSKQFTFSCIPSVSVTYPPDSSFRIFTWQVFVDDNHYRQYGLINTFGQATKAHILTDYSDNLEIMPQYEVLGADNWIGQIYFNIIPLSSKSKNTYILFGYDSNNYWSRRKYAEVLSFDETGTPKFGMPVFIKGTDAFSRIVMEYSAYSSARLNYDTQEDMIVFDFLTEVPRPDGQDMMLIPDGTYQGYKLKKGKWEYVEKLKITPMDAPPMIDRPDNSGKDIMGKKKGN